MAKLSPVRNSFKYTQALYILSNLQLDCIVADLEIGWPQTLATYFLVQMIGGNMGMASMSSIMRSIAKQGIRSGLGRSEATEKVSDPFSERKSWLLC